MVDDFLYHELQTPIHLPPASTNWMLVRRQDGEQEEYPVDDNDSAEDRELVSKLKRQVLEGDNHSLTCSSPQTIGRRQSKVYPTRYRLSGFFEASSIF